jgi:3-deoxy-D-manno-octulosonic-acid transferase
MVEWVYNVLLVLTSPVWGGGLLWRLVVQRKDRRAFSQRWLGLSAAALPAGTGNRVPRVWIHAVSVGEVMAVVPLVRALRRDHPGALLIGSTVTDLGQETMRVKLPELDAVCYLPYDLGWSIRRTLESIRPTLFLFAETELWPNLLLALRRRGVPSVMVNGRVSERSVRRYRWIAPFIRRVIRSVTALTVQREADRERFIRLGADPACVAVCGNVKADGASASPLDAAALKAALGVGAKRLIIAGSTHDPEERYVAKAFLELVPADSSLRLCIAPRHLDRCEAIERELRAMGLTPVRRSALTASGRPWVNAGEVVLLDTIGELASTFDLAAVVVMGGTFAPIGGHNLLEPAAAGRPVVFGPHIGQWKTVAEELVAGGGAMAVGSHAELASTLRGLLADDGARQRMGEASRAYVRSQQGAAARTMLIVERALEGANGEGVIQPSRSGHEPSIARGAALSAWLWNGGATGLLVKRLMAPAAWGYGALTTLRRRWYRQGWLHVVRLPVRVISVGNLTVGGSGKTPVVIAIARLIASTGRQVGVISRGYRGVRPPSHDPWLVSDGCSTLATVEGAGDEAILLARRLEGVPVAVGRDRAAAGRLLLTRDPSGRPPPEILILDDGFQHVRLHRDLNLLVIDGARTGLEQRLLPCGPLRESWSAVRDATAVIVVERSGVANAGVDDENRLRNRLRILGFDGPCFLARMRPSGLVSLPSGDPLSIAALADVDVAICSGIGHPESFRGTVRGTGARIIKEWVFQDHHCYAPREVESIMREARRLGATMLLTTEKDGVKLAAVPAVASGDGPRVAVINVTMDVEPESDWRQWLTRQGVLMPCVSQSNQSDRSATPERSAALFCSSSPGGSP